MRQKTKTSNKIQTLFIYLFICSGSTGFWTQGLMLDRQVLLLLESLHQPFLCDGYFQDRVSQTICPRLALNHDPPDLCFLSS
jgi:hypothetical protein